MPSIKLFNCVEYWCCAKERHREGGRHYHLAVKLTGMYRWKQVKESITKNHGIVVNLRDFKTGYYDAYRYTPKKDPAYIIIDNHPAGIEAPRSALAIATRAGTNTKSMEPGPTRPRQQRRLQPSDIYAVIVENNIKSDLKLCAHGLKVKEKENNPLLFNYVFNKDEKRWNSAIQTAWKMKNATAILERQNKNHMTILEEVCNGSCTDDCAERWLLQAKNTLQLNGLDPNEFAAAIRNLLEKGRGKHRNIILVGNSNCGITFLLKPLIYQCFTSPTIGTFNWVGTEKSECVILNDFRWSDKIMPSADLLNLLESEPVQIPVVKTHYAENPYGTKDTPIFVTWKSQIRKYERGEIDAVETEMMESRWNVFVFRHQFTADTIVDIQPCARCFATLVLGE